MTSGQEARVAPLTESVDSSALPALNAPSDYRGESAQQCRPPVAAVLHFPRTTARSLRGGAALFSASSVRRKSRPIRSLLGRLLGPWGCVPYYHESKMARSVESSGRSALSTTARSDASPSAFPTASVRRRKAARYVGLYWGRCYFHRMDKLNEAISEMGANKLREQFNSYTFFTTVHAHRSVGGNIQLHYSPKVTNEDRFDMQPLLAYTIGWNYSLTSDFLNLSGGLDFTYGRVELTERFDNSVPLLMQSGIKNRLTYRNDMFLAVPHLILYLETPSAFCFHFRAGYHFDLSGKYWRLGGKVRDFAKTSFSSPFLQAGFSLSTPIRVDQKFRFKQSEQPRFANFSPNRTIRDFLPTPKRTIYQ